MDQSVTPLSPEFSDIAVQAKFENYPADAQQRLLRIRSMIFELVSELELGTCEENLKWGEPSYAVKSGSPIRLDWKEKHPERVSIFFNCNTRLVATFRDLYTGLLEFDGNRELILPLSQPLPEKELKHCLQLALTYKKVKDLPLLGC